MQGAGEKNPPTQHSLLSTHYSALSTHYSALSTHYSALTTQPIPDKYLTSQLESAMR
ncbi:hypothetical protein [Nostoc sp. CMAA1605]|uniref:hypothetical protein n=1 Tax=Nostoc sp. CMAA1605 TaxID=2055159 RepID=UPI001F317CCE|nr:hypothetical protein [Nostoc sp. CMAA1605]